MAKERVVGREVGTQGCWAGKGDLGVMGKEGETRGKWAGKGKLWVLGREGMKGQRGGQGAEGKEMSVTKNGQPWGRSVVGRCGATVGRGVGGGLKVGHCVRCGCRR